MTTYQLGEQNQINQFFAEGLIIDLNYWLDLIENKVDDFATFDKERENILKVTLADVQRSIESALAPQLS